MKEINPATPPVPLTAEARAEIAALADRQRKAASLLMRIVSLAGGRVEDGMRMLPKPARSRIEAGARAALTRSYALAEDSRGFSAGPWGALTRQVSTDRQHRLVATVSGAFGGLGGLPTALAEIPVATTIIFRAVQGVAQANGEDPASEETRLECLRVFGAGGAGPDEAGIDTSFLGARLGLSGIALNTLIARVAPRFAAVLGARLAGQAVPILGAVAGAGTNWAFTGYYTEVAHVHFGLRRLVRHYGEEAVLNEFHTVLSGKTRRG
nr:EcsC family protein [Pseudoroseicyclus aestuarii]